MNTKIILAILRTNIIHKKLESSSRTFVERSTLLRSTFLTKTTNARLFSKKNHRRYILTDDRCQPKVLKSCSRVDVWNFASKILYYSSGRVVRFFLQDVVGSSKHRTSSIRQQCIIQYNILCNILSFVPSTNVVNYSVNYYYENSIT